MGLLESVTQPAASNAQAALDYHDLRTNLDSGNLAAAQQAYLRLQTDLLVGNSAQGNTGATLNLAV